MRKATPSGIALEAYPSNESYSLSQKLAQRYKNIGDYTKKIDDFIQILRFYLQKDIHSVEFGNSTLQA